MAERLPRPVQHDLFIAILELQESGYPHLHVLIDRYIPWAWIKASWTALGGGRIVDIRRVYNLHRIGHYLAKYLTKEIILSAPAKCRRFTTSRGIQLFKKPDRPSGWWLTDYSIEKLYFWAALAVISGDFDYDGSIFAFTTERRVRPFAEGTSFLAAGIGRGARACMTSLESGW